MNKITDGQVRELFFEFTDDEINGVRYLTKEGFKQALNKALIIHSVAHSKITALVTYWKWEESGHSMIDDSKNKITQIVEVDNLTDINGMFTNLIDVKILK